jgi:hypothetical protein
LSDFDENWNDELAADIKSTGLGQLVVFSRDWTVDTILRQIAQHNIDLNPKFQRRNAWNDEKRSKLIESLILGLPVPEIVLAEDREKKRSFIVIDGKQRLLALAGYANPEGWDSWDSAKLKGITSRSDLLGKTYADLESDSDDFRALINADIRCTVISNYSTNDTLYDIFYRLNTGSVSLSSQELRQVLKRGPFADFLIDKTNQPLPLHKVLNTSGPDTRLRDAEIVLRYIAFSLFGERYAGNLSVFLDSAMGMLNDEWDHYERLATDLFNQMQHATERLLEIFNDKVGRKATSEKYESRFNRALYEVQAYYFARIPNQEFELALKDGGVKEAFVQFSKSNLEFLSTIESTTKNLQKTRLRFALFQDFVNKHFGTKINEIPIKG